MGEQNRILDAIALNIETYTIVLSYFYLYKVVL